MDFTIEELIDEISKYTNQLEQLDNERQEFEQQLKSIDTISKEGTLEEINNKIKMIDSQLTEMATYGSLFVTGDKAKEKEQLEDRKRDLQKLRNIKNDINKNYNNPKEDDVVNEINNRISLNEQKKIEIMDYIENFKRICDEIIKYIDKQDKKIESIEEDIENNEKDIQKITKYGKFLTTIEKEELKKLEFKKTTYEQSKKICEQAKQKILTTTKGLNIETEIKRINDSLSKIIAENNVRDLEQEMTKQEEQEQTQEKDLEPEVQEFAQEKSLEQKDAESEVQVSTQEKDLEPEVQASVQENVLESKNVEPEVQAPAQEDTLNQKVEITKSENSNTTNNLGNNIMRKKNNIGKEERELFDSVLKNNNEDKKASYITDENTIPYICMTMVNGEEQFVCLPQEPLFGNFIRVNGNLILKPDRINNNPTFNSIEECVEYAMKKYNQKPIINHYVEMKLQESYNPYNVFENDRRNKK